MSQFQKEMQLLDVSNRGGVCKLTIIMNTQNGNERRYFTDDMLKMLAIVSRLVKPWNEVNEAR